MQNCIRMIWTNKPASMSFTGTLIRYAKMPAKPVTEWMQKSLILIFMACAVACAQPSTPPPREDAPPTTQVAYIPAQDNFFVVENTPFAEEVYTVPPGKMVTLHWRVTSAEEIYIEQTAQYTADAYATFGPLPPEGSLEVCPVPSQTVYYLYAGENPESNSSRSYDLSLVTWMEIGIDTPIDLETACWGDAAITFSQRAAKL